MHRLQLSFPSRKSALVKTLAFLMTCAFLLLSTSFVASKASAQSLQPQSGSGAIIYTHTATAANSAGDYTMLDKTGLNKNPKAVIIITPNWNPNGIGGVYDNHPVGVFYSAPYWYIFNEDGTAIPVGASFNIYATSSGVGVEEGAYIYTATSASVSYDYTVIDNPDLNGQPSMRILVTPNRNPPGHSGVYNNHPIGVFYTASIGKWAIFNQDLAAIPAGASFNINFASTIIAEVQVHTATSANSAGDFTCINDPDANNNPKALVFATPNWNPVGVSVGVYNNHNIGVFYNISKARWCIFNQDLAAIPTSASFNVYVF